MIIGAQQPTPEETLSAHGGLLVRRVAERGDELTDALFEIATEGRIRWTHSEAVRLERSLAACDQTVAEWLESRETQR